MTFFDSDADRSEISSGSDALYFLLQQFWQLGYAKISHEDARLFYILRTNIVSFICLLDWLVFKFISDITSLVGPYRRALKQQPVGNNPLLQLDTT